MDTRIGHQIGLELRQIHVEGAVESQGCSDGADDLTNQTTQVSVRWALDVQVTTADVVDCLVLNHEGTVGMLQRGVSRQDGVVGLHHSRWHLRSWVDGKLQFGLLAVVNTESLHQ